MIDLFLNAITEHDLAFLFLNLKIKNYKYRSDLIYLLRKQTSIMLVFENYNFKSNRSKVI